MSETLAFQEHTAFPYGAPNAESSDGPEIVNDVHSALNPTLVRRVVRCTSVSEVQNAVRSAARADQCVCVSGGRHAMGAQQFATGAVLLDMRGLSRILSLDAERGLVTVEAGAQWSEFIPALVAMQAGHEFQWGIAQKQTGADRLTLGGAISANAHGRGLTMAPFISDVESVVLVDASGDLVTCSRSQNAELFSLVVGGYGLFGVVVIVTLRLIPRRKLERVVQLVRAPSLMWSFARRISEGHLYGDFQFAIDPRSPDFLDWGLLSTYRPLRSDAAVPDGQQELSREQWEELITLAHVDKSAAFTRYAEYYLSTNGQRYWSDIQQLTPYLDHYHGALDHRLQATAPASEIITELYVPHAELKSFLAAAREDLRRNQVDVIYGTIRLIERDAESFLPWAREACVCIIFNLHTEHTASGIERSAEAFRRLIDLAAMRGGSYYLTYHRYATREQVLRCHPRLPSMLERKLRYDPAERFRSDWYRWYKAMFAG